MVEKRVAIVTGGTRGIGRAASLQLAREGCLVFPIYSSNKTAAAEMDGLLSEISSESYSIRADVSKRADVDKAINEITDKYGRIDILINNAGIFDFAFVENMTEEMLDKFYNVNFKSMFNMVQACLPYMKKQRYGRIVNASSISSTIADVGLVAYGTSKAAVNMFTKILSAELAPFEITVNAYSPGITHTDLTDEMIQTRGEQQAKQISLGRFGTCEEVAELICFLASEKASYITGEIVGVDGGFFKVQNPYRAYLEYAKSKD